MTTHNQPSPWEITLREWAELYGYPVETVRTWAKRGRFPWAVTVAGRQYVGVFDQPMPGQKRYGPRPSRRRLNWA